MDGQQEKGSSSSPGLTLSEIKTYLSLSERINPNSAFKGAYRIYPSVSSPKEAWELFESEFNPAQPSSTDNERTTAEKRQEAYEKTGFIIENGHLICPWLYAPLPNIPNINTQDLTSHPESEVKWARSNAGPSVVIRITTTKSDGSLELLELLMDSFTFPIR